MLAKVVVLVALAVSAVAFDCSTWTSCGSCASGWGCAWCSSSKTCQVSTANCLGNSYSVASACPCGEQTDCLDCLDAQFGGYGCGWCASGGSCYNGTSAGPNVGNTCSTNDWYFTDATKCPEIKGYFHLLGMGLGAFLAVFISLGVLVFCVIPGICIYFFCCRRRHGYSQLHGHGHH
eukprot:TRINITY_DN6704_c0_g1_i1.p1 TRINITY_DN6704_c0_g1~~TRINITY_DN6704_c0_g1_i1.p1  ORF type:complete len:177 (-),score=17.10 TRINITY_DN6704_c0_g1_i1:33-563(-)